MFTPMAQGGYFAGQQNQSPLGMQSQGQMQQYPMMSNQPQYPSQNWYGGVPSQQPYGGMMQPQQSNWYGGAMGGYGGGYSQPMQAQPPQQQFPQRFGYMQQPMTMMNQGMYGAQSQQQPSEWSQAMARSNQGGINAQPPGLQGQYAPAQQPQTQGMPGQGLGAQGYGQMRPMASGAQMPTDVQAQAMPSQTSKAQYDATIAGMRGIGYTDAMIRSTGWNPSGYNPAEYSQPGAAPPNQTGLVNSLKALGYNQSQLTAMGY